MRLVCYQDGNGSRVGVAREGQVFATAYRDVLEVIRAGSDAGDVAEGLAAAGRPAGSVKRLAPLRRPGKIFGSGINYASHKEENPAAVMPVEPGYFSKLPSSIIGPGDPIILPYPECQADYEVELAVIIGRAARRVSQGAALDYVFGYTVLNDVSARDVQFKEPLQQWITHGKGFDTFCPLGPEIVLRDEIPDPSRLRVRSYVNGELRQDAPTTEMLFPVPLLIEYWSRYITLEPGDILSTGTPAGCGTFRVPPLWLRPGDEVTVEVDAIGRLSNPVVAGW
ncbi:MAG: fumarylacetoacetate hydrolase family protein [Chloroflexota bacterium]|nr:fumarylacetoacetate hydrolase family protein [Chloroflexota bacterium]